VLKINVEAFADESRPRGGYAVILLRGISNIPPQPTIRLKPIDGGLDGPRHRAWIGEQIIPVATRLTEQGIQIVVGPEVVGNPHLLTGTPVMIEIPAANVRGEFVWPNVVPLALPRRRHMSASRRTRNRPVFSEPTAAIPLEPVEAIVEPAQAKVVPIHTAFNGAAHRVAQEPLPATETAAVRPCEEMPREEPAEAAAPEAVEPATLPAEATPAPSGAGGRESANALSLEPAQRAAPEPTLWQPAALARDRRLWLLIAGLALVSVLLSGLLHMVGSRHAGSAMTRTASASSATAAPAATTAAAKSEGGAAAPTSPAGKGGGASGGGARGGSSAAALTPAAVAAAVAPAPCTRADVVTEPLEAGMMRVKITSACRAGQDVHVLYGGAELVRRLDSAGTLDMTLDCFAGETTPVELKLQDGEQHTLAIATRDLGRVSKVAVVWKAPVNLDLHVFEYAADVAQKGHLWAKSSSTLEAARADIAADGRGHGFLSSLSDAAGAGDKLEVYTFLHQNEKADGIVTFALDHETRGGKPKEATCGHGALAEIAFSITTLSRNGRFVRENGIMASADCGGTLAEEARYQALPAPVLKVSN